MKLARCTTCQGTGRIARFSHHAEGICFSCEGTGKVRKTAALVREEGELALESAIDALYACHLFSDAEKDANVTWARDKTMAGADRATVAKAIRDSIARRWAL